MVDTADMQQFGTQCNARRIRILATLLRHVASDAPCNGLVDTASELRSFSNEAQSMGLTNAAACANHLTQLVTPTPQQVSGRGLTALANWCDRLLRTVADNVVRNALPNPACDRLLDGLAEEIRAVPSLDIHGKSKPFKLPAPQQRRLLIVDDSQLSLGTLSVALRAHGFDTETATGLDDMTRKMVNFTPDAIISGVLMADLDGDAICQTIKADPKRLTTPIILVSALPDSELNQRARTASADAFISKDLGAIEVAREVGRILDDLLP